MTEPVFDTALDPNLCGNGGATGMAFFVGSPAWFYCVRRKDHGGECVMGLSGLDRERLAELPAKIEDLDSEIANKTNELLALKCERHRLEEKARLATFMARR